MTFGSAPCVEYLNSICGSNNEQSRHVLCVSFCHLTTSAKESRGRAKSSQEGGSEDQLSGWDHGVDLKTGLCVPGLSHGLRKQVCINIKQ